MGRPVDFEDLRISATALFGVTLVLTSYRCFARFSRKIWGHDDSAALFSSLFFVFFVIGTSILARASLSQHERITGSYLMIVGFYTPVWGARISIVLTVIRVTPWNLQKKILWFVVAFFFSQYLVLVLQAFWVCEITLPGWKNVPGSICVLPVVVPITQIITTVISDGILIFAPLLIVRGVCIPALRSRLLRLFSVSVVTAMASVTHAVMVKVKPGALEAIFGGVEAAVSVMVCSMSVIIPAILRALDVGDPFMQEDTVDPGFTTTIDIVPMTLTRVELGLPLPNNSRPRATNMATPHKRDSIGSVDETRGQRHRLTPQVSGDSLGTSVETKVALRSDECDIADDRTFQSRSLPAIKGDDEGGDEKKRAKRNTM